MRVAATCVMGRIGFSCLNFSSGLGTTAYHEPASGALGGFNPFFARAC